MDIVQGNFAENLPLARKIIELEGSRDEMMEPIITAVCEIFKLDEISLYLDTNADNKTLLFIHETPIGSFVTDDHLDMLYNNFGIDGIVLEYMRKHKLQVIE